MHSINIANDSNNCHYSYCSIVISPPTTTARIMIFGRLMCLRLYMCSFVFFESIHTSEFCDSPNIEVSCYVLWFIEPVFTVYGFAWSSSSPLCCDYHRISLWNSMRDNFHLLVICAISFGNELAQVVKVARERRVGWWCRFMRLAGGILPPRPRVCRVLYLVLSSLPA